MLNKIYKKKTSLAAGITTSTLKSQSYIISIDMLIYNQMAIFTIFQLCYYSNLYVQVYKL